MKEFCDWIDSSTAGDFLLIGVALLLVVGSLVLDRRRKA